MNQHRPFCLFQATGRFRIQSLLMLLTVPNSSDVSPFLNYRLSAIHNIDDVTAGRLCKYPKYMIKCEIRTKSFRVILAYILYCVNRLYCSNQKKIKIRQKAQKNLKKIAKYVYKYYLKYLEIALFKSTTASMSPSLTASTMQ